MDANLFSVHFKVRYAIRVLDLQCRFWKRLDTSILFFGCLSGTAAFGAIMVHRPWLTLLFGVLFAIAQTVQLVLSPASRAAEAAQARKVYKLVLAGDARHSAEEMERAYLEAMKDDDVIVFESLRKIAYNNVAREVGSEKYSFALSPWEKMMSAVS